MTNSVKIPYNLAKGSEIERFGRAAKTNLKVFNEIKKEINYPLLDIHNARLALDKQIPRMITYIISEYEKTGSKNAGGTAVLKSKTSNELVGYEILLPLNESFEIHIQDLHIAMHEFRHLLDMINNPKVNQRKILISKFEDADFKTNYIDRIYQKKLYTTDKFSKKDVQDTLNFLLPCFTKNEQVNVLQMLRYRLKLEHNAYLETSKIQRELKRLYGNKFNKNDYVQARFFRFPQKIKLIEEKLKEVLFEIRSEHAQNIKTLPD